MLILGVDPGQTTGWCLIEAPLTLRGSGQIAASEFNAQALLTGLGPQDELVIESFRLRPSKGKAQGGSDMVAPRIIGALQEQADAQHVPVIYQEPSIKRAMSNELIHALGIGPKTGHHSVDAARHCVYRALATFSKDAVVVHCLRAYLKEIGVPTSER